MLGFYSWNLLRACRLVVDTGMHAMGWSRERAMDYLASHTALSLHEVRTETDRYISWPAQALSYKIGELKIRMSHLRSANNDMHRQREAGEGRWKREAERLQARLTEEMFRTGTGPAPTGGIKGFTKLELDSLMRLCHPDKHSGRKGATQMFQKIQGLIR